jgi:hypothetical protein
MAVMRVGTDASGTVATTPFLTACRALLRLKMSARKVDAMLLPGPQATKTVSVYTSAIRVRADSFCST